MAGVGRKRLDITPSEMMELRKQGYSNRDIANMLDICIQTVRKYIGRQDGRMDNLEAFKDKPKPEKAVVASAEPAIPTYVPNLISEKYTLCGSCEALDVEIDHIGETLCIKTVNSGICITFDEARELVRFLAWASDKCKPTKEDENEDNT